MTILKSPE